MSTKQIYVALSYGQGGSFIDGLLSFNGTGSLNNKIAKLGSTVSAPGPYSWIEASTIASKIKGLPVSTLIAVGGTSLGANEAPRVGAMVNNRPIDFMFGIQPSLYGAKNAVTANVKRAMFFRNPIWPITMGLGAYQWVRAKDNHSTILIEYSTYAPHPGDNVAWIHEMILAEIKKLIAA